jgi:hypothetical protein
MGAVAGVAAPQKDALAVRRRGMAGVVSLETKSLQPS